MDCLGTLWTLPISDTMNGELGHVRCSHTISHNRTGRSALGMFRTEIIASNIAWILFVVFLVLAIISFFLGPSVRAWAIS